MSLNVAHISKKFGSQPVLQDVSFTIEKGQILSLTGESGCGKSTLLRIISGLEYPDNGTISWNGEDITNWKPEKRKFGFVFQNLSLFPHLSVKQNISFASPKQQRNTNRINDLLKMVGLEGLGERMPHQLSGGQQQRVAIARALAIDPEILILDEPFSSLDELLKAKIREEIFALLKSLGITTILVSHQATDAFLIADQLIIMKDGAIKQMGTPSAVYSHPVSPYVSNFFGASVIIDGKSDDNKITTSFGTLNMKTDRTGDLQLFIRPENIEITHPNSFFNLSGIVLKKEFKGPHDVLKIKSNNSEEVISVETERCDIAVGEDIYLNVPEKDIQIFD